MLKPALQGVDRGRAKLKLRVVDVKALPSRDSIAFVSQRASPATYAWFEVDGVQNYESQLTDLLFCKIVFVETGATRYSDRRATKPLDATARLTPVSTARRKKVPRVC